MAGIQYAAGAGRDVLATVVYDALKERILDQRLPAGVRLSIDALALELGVSQTPMREALVRLATERLLTCAAFKGYAVAPMLTPRQLNNLFHVRRLLEIDAARQAAARVLPSQLQAMERELAAQAAQSPSVAFADFRAFNRHDQRFHELVVAAADNDMLLATYQLLAVHHHLSLLHFGHEPVDTSPLVAEHTAIYRALDQRDADAAAQATRVHLDAAERLLSALLDAPPVARAALVSKATD
jgi:DNA-binding GntR family transcriptional regulator